MASRGVIVLRVEVAGLTVAAAAHALDGLVISDVRGTGATLQIIEAAEVTEVTQVEVQVDPGNGEPPGPPVDDLPPL
jgi:hypothetical protein